MSKDPAIQSKGQPTVVNKVPTSTSTPSPSLSTNKGVFVALAGLFVYAILLQLANGTTQSTGETFQFLDVKVDATTEGSGVIMHSSSRNLFQDDSNSNTDPIDPKNKICRDYLKKFLEGSTDSKDECEGLENAYSAADCSDDINDNPLNNMMTISASMAGGDSDTNPITNSPSSNDNNDGDDQPAIDDFFEEFQCCKVISHYYSSRCLYHQQFASLSLLGIVAVLILCNLVKSLLQIYGIKWLPEAGGCILVGAAVGAALTVKLPGYQMNLGTFNDDLFLFILLPPIIFHASLSIDKAKFRAYIFPIMML